MNLKIRKKNFITWSFFFVVISLENFSWLIDPGEYLVPGLLKFSDIGVLSAIAWMICSFIIYKTKRRQSVMISPLLYVGVVLISSVAAFKIYGQGYALTLRQNRYILSCFLMYYAIIHALKCERLKLQDLIGIISFQATVEIVLFIVQYILYTEVSFLHISVDSRYGDIRMRVSYLLPMVYMYICINELLNGKTSLKNIILIIAGAFVLFGLCKHRAPSIIMLGTFIIAYYLWKQKIGMKMLMGGILGIGALFFILDSQLVQDAFSILLEGKRVESTLDIRDEGRQYYFEKLKESMIVGFGEPNENCEAAINGAGFQYDYFLVDNGVFGFLYSHGILGIVWLIGFWIVLLKQAWYLYKNENKYQYILYMIYETANLYMGMHWYYYYALPFILMITAMNYEYTQAIKLKKMRGYANEQIPDMCGSCNL